MSEVIKIGYQGIEGSNSRASAENMAKRLNWENVSYVPLVTSRGVVDALLSGEVDYGVMASNNHIAGIVQETVRSLEGLNYLVLSGDTIPIHHCLFVKDSSVTEIKTVASHIQALKQCAGNLSKRYPEAQWKELEDTAIGARYLYDGTLPNSTGVLCRRNAGEAFDLYLLEENLEDDTCNATDFILIALEAD